MLLRSVRVENFRAVKSARITFDPTTVLIGENDCGRSSVMEAVALALGWNAGQGEFLFQPFHAHRTVPPASSAAAPILIALEFRESTEREWEGSGFEALRRGLPHALGRNRRFWLEVTNAGEGTTRWSFRCPGQEPLPDNRELLAWLRRRMPVFWMSEGIRTGKADRPWSKRWTGGDATRLADQVSKHYRELLEGTALDVTGSIEAGAEAAQQLFLARKDLLTDPATPLGHVLQEIAGARKLPRPRRPAGPAGSFGTAAQKIGILLLVGSLLRAGRDPVEKGTDPLTLIENPEAHLHPMTLASIWNVMDRVAGQKIIATHSGSLLASARLASVRRLTRHEGVVREWRVPEGALTTDELRRYSYHLRSRRAAASFARCWLLVEGETEFWLMGELARVCGYDLASEGVACVEFAQCGLAALIKVAQHLGIEWHLLADGDQAGQTYAGSARQHAGTSGLQNRITLLREPDVEHCFWRYGYADVFRRAAYPRNSTVDASAQRRAPARAVIKRAIERHSKPFLAVLLLDEAVDRGPAGVPPPLKNAIETCVRLARSGSAGA